MKRGCVWLLLGMAAVGEPAWVLAAEPASSAGPTVSGSVVAAVSLTPEQLLAEGVQLRKQGEDSQALSKFRQAWSMSGSNQALAQAALAEQALGFWVAAHVHLSRALRPPGSPWIEQHEPALQESLREISAHVGQLQVECNVAGAALFLDDQPLGRAPLAEPALTPVGQGIVRATAPGHFTITRPVSVDPGGLTRVRLVLTPTELAPVTATASERSSAEPVAREGRAMLYGAGVLSAMGVVAGAVGYTLREVNVRLYNDDSRCDRDPRLGRSRECPDEYSAWRLGQTTAIVGFGGAAVFGGLGAYLWLKGPRAPEGAASALACGVRWLSEGTPVLGCAGRL